MTTGNDVALYDGGQLDGYRPQIMTAEAARELDRQLRACTKAVLRDGTDFGALPGTDGKSVLFKPGAEKLLQWFGLSYSCDRLDIEHDAEGRKEGVTYRAVVLKRLPDGQLVTIATCEGYAGYDEDKFYQSAEAAQAKAEAKERHWAERDHRVANPTKWKYITEYRAPWNTVIKMAQKRAIVGAVINATAAGGLFTADDDSDSALADGTPSWYQQALGEAASFTTKEDGRRLYAEATQAKLSGAASRDQADHVQNRIKLRVQQLETHIQADVEDLTPADPQDASLAGSVQPTPPAAAQVPPPPAGGAPARPPAKASSGQVTAIERKMRELGYGDEPDEKAARLRATARLAGRKGELTATRDLTQPEAALVRLRIDSLPDPAALHALLDDLREAEAQDAAGEPDGA